MIETAEAYEAVKRRYAEEPEFVTMLEDIAVSGYGLFWECASGYDSNRKAGASPIEAAWLALTEWDL